MSEPNPPSVDRNAWAWILRAGFPRSAVGWLLASAMVLNFALAILSHDGTAAVLGWALALLFAFSANVWHTTTHELLEDMRRLVDHG